VRIAVRDTVLFFDVVGAKLAPDGARMSERPTVVLVHGGPGVDHTVFRPHLDELADVAQLVFLDQRGHGRSDPGSSTDWNLASWADDLAAFVDALQITSPVVMGGSWGVDVGEAYYANPTPEHEEAFAAGLAPFRSGRPPGDPAPARMLPATLVIVGAQGTV
jgi:pimeloyl-ACP methyl ester carboxylesterase